MSEIHDIMDPARAAALHAALGRAGPAPAAGDALPPFFHQIHFWDPHPPGALGRDGHPRRGGIVPDTGLPRRMWAGGRLAFHRPLRAGSPALRRTLLERTEEKQGRSGRLAFVTLRHEVEQAGTLAVTEWQDLVFREDPDPARPQPEPPRAPAGAETRRETAFSTTLLFRYSALTFNGHRIHYDLDYCRRVEGYPGLVVHGPLLAQMLMLMAAERGPLERFSFRATAPLFHHETAQLCAAGDRLWVAGPEGRLCMSAEAEWAEG